MNCGPFTCLLSVAAAAVVFTSQAAANWTDQAFQVKSHNFGTVAVGAKTEFRFPIYNPLNQPIHIQTVRASCGCTTPIVETPYIEPGQSGSILARFNTPTFRGKKGATLTVVIDKPYYTEVRLRVDGYIRSDMVFHPGEIDFGMINRGDSVDQSTRVLYAGRGDWQIVDVRSSQPWIQASKEEVKRSGGSVEYKINVAIREDAPIGFFQNEVVVTTNDRSMPRVPLIVSGRVDAALTIAPQSLALGQLKIGQAVEERLVIRGQEPFTIDAIECEGWDIAFEPITQAKKMHIFTVKFTPTESATSQKQTVVIKTGGDKPVTAKAMLTADVQ
ncbi:MULTISPECIES: DUF1573 domain-containing protein [Crateriforma]|uniref:DUF1573 domain-containing protein n=1 Tax=Crateriforma conspicua TaxID=2527996 RepID=A0A5C5XZV7_9PLAN|nr:MULTISPECIES: DUF1573 domain-containing protein [Crateriforma]QDV63395.1 hypothetical protein Mal65_25380 [Crateriforma conspicua]TWT67833.1 hypothetical protein Pan14r_00700 [Crateriforma conspicua]